MDLGFTKMEKAQTRDALRNLLNNISFTEVSVRTCNLGYDDLKETRVLFYVEFGSTRGLRREPYGASITPLHTQIIEGLAGKRSTEWVKFGAGRDWCWGFRVIEADRRRENFEAGVIQLRIEATKLPHDRQSALTRAPKWL